MASWKFFRLCNVFFCDLREEDSLPDLYCPKIRGRMYQTVRRNFPKPGFSIFTLRSVSGAFDVICVGIPQLSAGLFTIEVALRIPKFAGWASMHFPTLLLSLRDLVHWFLNRPGVHDMRSLDSQFYLVLTMQTWRRGFPFLPAVDDEEAKDTLTTINAGRRRGLVTWVRYHPRMVGSEFFHLSEYLSLFLQRIGMPLTLHQSLDGQELLPYQCAVQEELWQQIAPHFRRAYMLQKTAYRRANGGSTAPAITEGTEPRFGDRSTASRPGPEEAAKPSWNLRSPWKSSTFWIFFRILLLLGSLLEIFYFFIFFRIILLLGSPLETLYFWIFRILLLGSLSETFYFLDLLQNFFCIWDLLWKPSIFWIFRILRLGSSLDTFYCLGPLQNSTFGIFFGHLLLFGSPSEFYFQDLFWISSTFGHGICVCCFCALRQAPNKKLV